MLAADPRLAKPELKTPTIQLSTTTTTATTKLRESDVCQTPAANYLPVRAREN